MPKCCFISFLLFVNDVKYAYYILSFSFLEFFHLIILYNYSSCQCFTLFISLYFQKSRIILYMRYRMEDIKHLLGQNIKKLRVRKGLSQQELAELVNID